MQRKLFCIFHVCSLEMETPKSWFFVLRRRRTTNQQNPNPNSNPTTDQKPNHDDVCPICFDNYTVPCRTRCGHWYCGHCILEYWDHCNTALPVKCPMCETRIYKLTPSRCVLRERDDEITKVLRDVERYNNLFVGGVGGFIQRVCRLPLYTYRCLHRYIRRLMGPDGHLVDIFPLRLCAVMVGLIISILPFDFIQKVTWNIPRLLELCVIYVATMLKLAGFLRIRQPTFSNICCFLCLFVVITPMMLYLGMLVIEQDSMSGLDLDPSRDRY